jgi:hypothetical protein
MVFNKILPTCNSGYWIMICSIVGGGSGVFFGGVFSDLLVKKLGIRQGKFNF